MEQKIIKKPIFDDEFKQGVVDYTLQHPDEFKVSIAKKIGIADSTVAIMTVARELSGFI